jgi:septal ring factor EnvC (AmiA/AmiB activator)
MNFHYAGSLSTEAKQRLTLTEVEQLEAIFRLQDKARTGVVPTSSREFFVKALGEQFGNVSAFSDVFSSFSGQNFTYPDFVQLFISAHKSGKRISTREGMAGAIHSFSEEEKSGYVDHINSNLRNDPDLQGVVPINPSNLDLFSAVSRGVLLCKLINQAFPNTINESKLNVRASNPYEKNENHELCIAAAKKLGVVVENIGASDLLAGTPHLVLGLVWQIIKKSLLAQVTANLSKTESGVIDMPPEKVLFTWFNYHLAKAGETRKITNWGKDLQDSVLYMTLLSQLDPSRISKEECNRALTESDLLRRAETVLEFADRLGCCKFITAKEILNANPRLNLAFVATLFNTYPQMGPTEEELRLNSLQEKLGSTEQKLDRIVREKDTVAEQLQRITQEKERTAHELEEVSEKLSDANAERDTLARIRTQLESQLENSLRDNNSLTADIERLNAEKDDLSNRLDEEKAARQLASTQRDQLQVQLLAAQKTADEEVRALNHKLGEQTASVASLTARLQETETLLHTTQAQAAQTQAALQKQLADDQAKRQDLEQQLRRALEANADLTRKLAEETAAKELLAAQLRETQDELEDTRLESDEEKTLLLQRIKDLEEELDQLRELMANSLNQAAREKAEDLRRAAEAKEQALSEAERARIAQMKKVQGLLSKVQREGTLYKQEKGAVLGTVRWKKRYFVLQDNLLSFYKDLKAYKDMRPEGIIYCEQCRVYEVDQAVAKRSYTFQLDNGKQQVNLSASKLEEMKEWMKDIKEAKKKAVGVKVVSEDKTEPAPVSPRGTGGPSPSPSLASSSSSTSSS